MSKAREARMEACLLNIKQQLLLALGQEQRTAAHAIGKATKQQAEHTAELLQDQLAAIDAALESDTAVIEQRLQ